MQNELLGLSQCLSSHPVLTMNKAYIVKYLNALEYFVRRFSGDEIFAQEMLNLYIEAFVGKENYFYELADTNGFMHVKGSNIWNKSTLWKMKSKWANTSKLREYKLFRHRFALLFDCCFINAFDSPRKAGEIKWEIKNLFHERYHPKMEQLYRLLYDDEKTTNFENIKVQLECWQKNQQFFSKPLRKILITANMSAGKSTLINALVGKKVNRTQNDACTAKIHYIFNKPYEDNYSCEWDYNLQMNADITALMQDNPNSKSDEISVGTYFQSSVEMANRICIIDTPGVNSSLNLEHRELSYNFIEKGKYDYLVCVMNASNIGTYDDIQHLQHIYDFSGNKKVIFVINQLDKFDKDEDDIEACVESFQKDIEEIGFKNAIICPLSAYAGVLAKKKLYNENMTEIEKIELQMMILKFQENEEQMKKFFVHEKHVLQNEKTKSEDKTCLKLLYQSGLANLEKVLFE